VDFNQSEAPKTVEISERTVNCSVADSFRKKHKKSKKPASDFDSSITDNATESDSIKISKMLHKKKEASDDPIKSSNSCNECIDITNNIHKKKEVLPSLDDHNDSTMDNVTSASIIPKKSHKKKKGVPAMDDHNSGVVKVIEIRKNKNKTMSSVILDSGETSFGSGLGGGWS